MCCEYIRLNGKMTLRSLVDHHMLASDRRSFFERESENTVTCKRVYCSCLLAFLEDLPFVVLNICLVIRPFMSTQTDACRTWVIDQNSTIFSVCKLCFSVVMLTHKLKLLKDFPHIWSTRKALVRERKELDHREIKLFYLFCEGERITHKVHGDGTVAKVNLHDPPSDRRGEKLIYIIVFDNGERHRYSEFSSNKLTRTNEQLRPIFNASEDLVKGAHVWHAERGWGAIEAVDLTGKSGKASSVRDHGFAGMVCQSPGASLSRNSVLEVCQNHKLFREHSSNRLEALVAKMVPHQMTTGEVLFRIGDKGSDMFVLESGELACVARNNEDLNVLKAGACFGELAALGLHTERTLTVRAKCPALVYRLTSGDFEVKCCMFVPALSAYGFWAV